MSEADRPSTKDYGLSDEQLAAAPSSFVGSHRPALVVAVVGAFLVALAVVLCQSGGSLGASLFFAVLLGAASLVLLVPAAFVVVCLSEQAEDRWRCATSPLYAAARAYRKAVAAFEARERGEQRQRERTDRRFWTSLTPERLRCELLALLENHGFTVEKALDREATGADRLVRREGRLFALRLHAGKADAALGREMVAACQDLGADEALLVCLGPVTAELRRYVADRPVELVDLKGVLTLARGEALQP